MGRESPYIIWCRMTGLGQSEGFLPGQLPPRALWPLYGVAGSLCAGTEQAIKWLHPAGEPGKTGAAWQPSFGLAAWLRPWYIACIWPDAVRHRPAPSL